MSYRFITKTLLGLFISIASFANVNTNNGNYHAAFSDFKISSKGLAFEIVRTYNSRSNFIRGYFGVGWSSELDTYIDVKKDSIVYRHGGGGNILVFKKDKKGYVNKSFGLQNIKVLRKGYLLENQIGRKFYFNKKGQLSKIADSNKNYITIDYLKSKNQILIKDNNNTQVKIKTEKFGGYDRITLIENGGQKARYRYSKVGNLVKAKGDDAIPFEFDYDGYHNLTQIKYSDGTTKEIKYNVLKDWAVAVTEPDNFVTEYAYFADKIDPENKFGTTVTRYEKGSKVKQSARFWYEFRRRNDGSRYNLRSVTMLDGQITETQFTECCGTPLIISRWNAKLPKTIKDDSIEWIYLKGKKMTTRFKYYPDGLLAEKTLPTGVKIKLAYNPVSKKIAMIQKGSRKTEYHYDSSDNLAWAVDHYAKKRIDLSYDVAGRIKVLNEKPLGQAKLARQVQFYYDANGRPAEVKELFKGDAGIIKFNYGKQGEVVAVLNSKGRQIASVGENSRAKRVYETFDYLLELVEPSGVDLGPEG